MAKQQICSSWQESASYFFHWQKVAKNLGQLRPCGRQLYSPTTEPPIDPFGDRPSGQWRLALREVVGCTNSRAMGPADARRLPWSPPGQAGRALIETAIKPGLYREPWEFPAIRKAPGAVLVKATTYPSRGLSDEEMPTRQRGVSEEFRRRLWRFTTSPKQLETALIFWLLLYQGKSKSRFPGREQWRLA